MSATIDQVIDLRKTLDALQADIDLLRENSITSHDVLAGRVTDVTEKAMTDMKTLSTANDASIADIARLDLSTTQFAYEFKDPQGRLKLFEVKRTEAELKLDLNILEIKNQD